MENHLRLTTTLHHFSHIPFTKSFYLLRYLTLQYLCKCCKQSSIVKHKSAKYRPPICVFGLWHSGYSDGRKIFIFNHCFLFYLFKFSKWGSGLPASSSIVSYQQVYFFFSLLFFNVLPALTFLNLWKWRLLHNLLWNLDRAGYIDKLGLIQLSQKLGSNFGTSPELLRTMLHNSDGNRDAGRQKGMCDIGCTLVTFIIWQIVIRIRPFITPQTQNTHIHCKETHTSLHSAVISMY